MCRLVQKHVTDSLPCKEHRSHNTHHHVALIVKRGKVLAQSHNRIGTRSRGVGFSHQTIHAERAVVKELGDLSKLRGASLCVWRISAMNILPSKPCDECQKFLEKCMREYGLLKVYYSDTIIPF
jgi:hypothetical protein